jgi:hypothetical protein
MGLTNFPRGVSSFGIPCVGGGGIPATSGQVVFVDSDNGSDGRSLKSNSIKRAFKTIAKAYASVVSNANDVIALVGSATHTLTEMLTVAKNRVHFIGLDCAGRMYGQGAKVSLGITTAVTDLATILNLGGRNSFQNLKIINSNTLAQALYSFIDGGEYMFMNGCEIYKESMLNITGAAELVMNGDSAQVYRTTIGSLANLLVGNVIRPNVLMTKGIAGAGLVARDVAFKDCQFWKKASHVNNRFFYGANATDVERMLLIENGLFFSQKLSGAVPAQCVEFAAEQTSGYVLLRNCESIGNTKLSTTTGVYIAGTVPGYATSGIAVAA